MEENYHPLDNDTLGAYLKRLRKAASATQDEVARMTANLPAPQNFTAAWLSVAEGDGYKQPGREKLRVLSSIYSRLLKSDIPAEWFFSLAGYDTMPLTTPVRAASGNEVLDELLRNEDILALVAAAGQLLEMGHPEEVRLLVVLAQRYIHARDPERRIGDIFDDPVLSAHVEKFMEAMLLI